MQTELRVLKFIHSLLEWIWDLAYENEPYATYMNHSYFGTEGTECKSSGVETKIFQWPLLLTWFHFNLSMDK